MFPIHGDKDRKHDDKGRIENHDNIKITTRGLTTTAAVYTQGIQVQVLVQCRHFRLLIDCLLLLPRGL